jgi:hypothetical protein
MALALRLLSKARAYEPGRAPQAVRLNKRENQASEKAFLISFLLICLA